MSTNDTPKSPWTKLFNLLNLERRDILQVLYYAVFAGIISLTIPLGIQAIINLIQGAEVSTSWILLTVVVTIGVGFFGALQVIQLDIVENIQEKIFARGSYEFVYKFPRIKVHELENRYPPELANRFFDVLTLQKGMQKLLLDLPAAVIQIIFGLLLLSLYHPFFIGMGLVLITLLYIVFKMSIDSAVESSLKESKMKYKTAFWIQQVAGNFKTFKNTPNEFEQEKNDGLVEQYLKERQRHFKLVKRQFMQLVGFKVLITLGLLLVGGLLVLNQQMNIGQFVASEIIIVLIINSIDKIGFSLESIYDVVTAVEKIDEVSAQKTDLKAPSNAQELSIFPIELDELKLHFGGTQTFTIEQGDQLNITGSHLRIYDLFQFLGGMKRAPAGKLYLNKKEISGINLDLYRNQIGLVLNSNYLFEGTVWENLTLNNHSIEEQYVFKLLDDFGMFEEINQLPNTIHTNVFPGTYMLSHALTQKICLIGALLKNPELLLIEEDFQFTAQDLAVIRQYAREQNITLLLASREPLDPEFPEIKLK